MEISLSINMSAVTSGLDIENNNSVTQTRPEVSPASVRNVMSHWSEQRRFHSPNNDAERQSIILRERW